MSIIHRIREIYRKWHICSQQIKFTYREARLTSFYQYNKSTNTMDKRDYGMFLKIFIKFLRVDNPYLVYNPVSYPKWMNDNKQKKIK